MVSRTVARRYGKGLLQAAIEGGESADEQQLAEQLAQLSAVVRGHDGLQFLLITPAITSDKKAAVLGEIVARLRLHPLLRTFLGLLAEKERLDHLHLIAEVYRQLVDDHRGVVTAEVTTPSELDAAQEQAVRRRLQEALGRDVQLITRTEPAILGGLVTRIGDVLYDGSLRSHLDRIRRQMGSA